MSRKPARVAKLAPSSATYRGEVCRQCGEPAFHKVGEEFPPDWPPLWYVRHNLSVYLCCAHFVALMGAGLTCCRQDAAH